MARSKRKSGDHSYRRNVGHKFRSLGVALNDQYSSSYLRNDNGNPAHHVDYCTCPFSLLGGLGVDEVHFGVVMVLNLMIGMITPPIGLNLFIISQIGGVGVIEIFKEAIPYFLILVFVLMIITYFPGITLFLPDMVFDR